MARAVFITGTGTDIGKTYVAGLLTKQMREQGYNCGYYKAAVSGAETAAVSDAGYVRQVAGLEQSAEALLSYCYPAAVSPHLAARQAGNPIRWDKIRADYQAASQTVDYLVMEGSGGIICPLRWDEQGKLMLEQLVLDFDLAVIIVADAGLGTINATGLTISYLRARGIGIRGVILNRFEDCILHRDNAIMIEALGQVSIIGYVGQAADRIDWVGEPPVEWFA